ncbi:cation:proton antiporter [Telluribacter sp.]|jgi:Kef-type K+ transport system membrane component KefB|uniref:cation:proton antiporter n=1 Tax=Telluribacter sp. TaxID=1978767 RepID=UPI002E15C4B3|nr:cation:proton antiporter [Telluribacter sp.]
MSHFFDHLINEFDLPLRNPVLVFSLILFIILLSPILLRKFNIPGIIVLILSGVVIGPNGLNLLAKSSAVDLFSTIGLLYIMFIAGLELDMAEFRTNRNKSLVFGFFTFIIPLSIGYPVCHYLLGYDFNASILTASMFATHTMVAYPIVSRLGIATNQAVAVTVGGTILTDTAVLIILAVIIGSSEGSLTQEFWITLGISLAIFSAIMFLLIPRIAEWFFRKLEAEKHSHYIFVLSVVFFAAFLAEAAGVEPIIGAFVAGLALNRLIPRSSALMNRIDFIGNALFIPFFLISVGMLVDISVIFKGPVALIVAGTLSVVALTGKWLAALFTQFFFKYSTAQRQLIYGLSSAHAAATLAVILVGYHADILDENILNGTIILILITCVVSSFATEKAAKKIIFSAENETTIDISVSGTSEHILLPIANINNFEKLLDFAILIKDKKSSHPISLLSVVPNDEEAELNVIRAKNSLATFIRHASAAEMDVNVLATIDHNIARGIARTSIEIMSDILVLGWPQRSGLIDRIFGEKIYSIINSADKTTFICDFVQPLAIHKRMLLTSLPMSELENGFSLWLSKMIKLSQELSIPVLYYCNQATQESVNRNLKQLQLNIQIDFRVFNDWNDFAVLSEKIQDGDLFVFTSARKGSVSYLNALDNLPFKMQRYFGSISKILIYPHQNNLRNRVGGFRTVHTSPTNVGRSTIKKIGENFNKILKPEKINEKKDF